MIDFTLYPNIGGNLGEKKVQIPDGVTTFWPEGDALVGNFIYKDGKLSGFVDTKALIANESKSTTIPYDFVETEFENVREDSVKFNLGERCKYFTLKLIPKYKGCKTLDGIKVIESNYANVDIVDGVWNKELSDLEHGERMFVNCENLVTFKSNLISLTRATSMFAGCHNLTNFTADLSSLNDSCRMFDNCSSLINFNCENLNNVSVGEAMFINCVNLTSFNSDLSSLTNGQYMFSNCESLTEFNSLNLGSLIYGRVMFNNCFNLINFNCEDLSSLTNGDSMFSHCSSLINFNCEDLSSLTEALDMFNTCSNLKKFNSNLKSLINAPHMFGDCNQLSSFTSNLESLVIGNNMFHNCVNLTSFKANLSSIENAQYIFSGCKLDAQSIKNIIDTINTVTESPLLSLGIGCDNNTTDKDLFAQEVGYSDMTTLLQILQDKGWTVSAQYNGRPTSNYSLRQPESLPVFVKLIEVIPSEEDSFYEYTSFDGSKFYNLDWFHETTGSTDGYTQFSSLEEAISSWNIVPKE